MIGKLKRTKFKKGLSGYYSEGSIIWENKKFCEIIADTGKTEELIKFEDETYTINYRYSKEREKELKAEGQNFMMANVGASQSTIYNSNGERISEFDLRSEGKGRGSFGFLHGKINGLDVNIYEIDSAFYFITDVNGETVGAIIGKYSPEIYVKDKKWEKIICLIAIFENNKWFCALETYREPGDLHDYFSHATPQAGLREKIDEKFIEDIRKNTKPEYIPERPSEVEIQKSRMKNIIVSMCVLISCITFIAAVIIFMNSISGTLNS